jgi:tRNA 2-thiouridine synthesizing protein B
MSTLHIVRQSAFNSNDFSQCIQVLGKNDVITFIDDGCYNLAHNLINSIESNKNIQLTVVAQHANARAIKINEAKFTKITMNDLVSLTFDNDRVITWQ